MATILSNKYIPFGVVVKSKEFLLLSITPNRDYGKDGKPTDKINGYIYEVVETQNFNKYRFKIKDVAIPLMSDERLCELREAGEPIRVHLDAPTVYMFFSKDKQEWSDSFSAEGIRLIDDDD